MYKPNSHKVFLDCGEYENYEPNTQLKCYVNDAEMVYISIGDPEGDEVYQNQCIVLDAETTKELIRTLISLVEEIE